MSAKRFLVIDDDALVRESIQLMLMNDNNSKVDLAKDGMQGLEFFKKNHGNYDIIITDIIMPEKAGFQTINELILLNKKIKIIAISGGARTGGAGSYLPIASQLGAKAILYKPFNEDELMLTINKICSH